MSPCQGGGGGRASGDGSGEGQSPSDAALGPQESPENGDAERPKSGDGLRASEMRGDDARDDCCARLMDASDRSAPPAGDGTRNMGEALLLDRSKSSYSASFWGENSGCSLISISSSSEDMAMSSGEAGRARRDASAAAVARRYALRASRAELEAAKATAAVTELRRDLAEALAREAALRAAHAGAS